MRNYLILREKARRLPRRPGGRRGAGGGARSASSPSRPWARGSRWTAARTSRTTRALGERGLQFERLDQLAMEHLLGVR